MQIDKHEINPEKLDGFMRLREVLKLIPVSKSTWWTGVKNGRYPKPVKLSIRTTAWNSKDIKDLLESFEN